MLWCFFFFYFWLWHFRSYCLAVRMILRQMIEVVLLRIMNNAQWPIELELKWMRLPKINPRSIYTKINVSRYLAAAAVAFATRIELTRNEKVSLMQIMIRVIDFNTQMPLIILWLLINWAETTMIGKARCHCISNHWSVCNLHTFFF